MLIRNSSCHQCTPKRTQTVPPSRKDPIAALLYILPSKTHHAFSKVQYNASLCGGIFARNVFSRTKTIHNQMPLTRYHKDPPWPLRSAQ